MGARVLFSTLFSSFCFRAKRFGVDFTDKAGVQQNGPQQQKPKRKARPKNPQNFKKPSERTHTGFKSGLDVYSQGELAKRDIRASRFGVEHMGFSYAPVEDNQLEAKKKARAARFGTQFQAADKTGLDHQDLLEERKEHEVSVQRRPDSVHLYGVDVMSTSEVMAYFEDYGPQQVEWLDDSSCNIKFADEFSTKRAIIGLGKPLGPGEAPHLQGLDPSDISSLPYLWHKGKDFIKGDSRVVPLIYRMATVEDVKGMAPTKRSRYLWTKQAQPKAKAGKRGHSAIDEDGDVTMRGAPNARLKSRLKRQRRETNKLGLQLLSVGLGDSADVETSSSMAAEPKAPSPEETPEEVAERAAARARQKAEGPSGIFSAAQAGFLPSFLMPGGGVEAGENVENSNVPLQTD